MPCRLCIEFEQDSSALKNQLEKYIEALDINEKVNDELYLKRLNKCQSCAAMNQGLCRYCGCFVIVRAVKKRMNCPNPNGELWEDF